MTAPGAGEQIMIYVLAVLLPPVGLLLNGQPFAAIFNLVLIVFCVILGLVFHVLLLVPSATPQERNSAIKSLWLAL
jgi:uncharacterized membrane protein YqaE (UPF0057 family)